MNLISPTFSYLKKNFWYLLLLSIPAAVFLAFFFRPFSELTFIAAYANMKAFSMSQVFMAIIDRGLIKIYPIFIALFLLLITISLIISTIERHFRTGLKKIRSPFKSINICIFPVIVNLLIALAVVILFKFLTFGAVSLLNVILNNSINISVLNFVLTTIISIGLFVVFCLILCPLLLVAPVMIVFGYSFLDACTASVRLASKGLGKLLGAILVPVAFVIMVQLVMYYLQAPFYVYIIVNSICYMYMIEYVCVFIMISVFELNGIERRDNKKIY